MLPAFAETAVLECLAASGLSTAGAAEAHDLPLQKGILLEFNITSVKGWRIGKATLLIHFASGRPSSKIQVRSPGGKRAPIHRVSVESDGWVHIEIRGSAISPLEIHGEKRASIHTRESIHFAPYLIVEGSAP